MIPSGILPRTILLDVNVLLAAIVEVHAHHEVATDRLFRADLAGERVLVPEEACASFLRIVSNPTLFPSVGGTQAASSRFRAWRDAGAIEVALPGGARLDRVLALVGALALNPRDVPDAFLAAFAMERDATLVTFDRGFGRFSGLKVEILQVA